MQITVFIKRHPATTFFALTFLWAWGWWTVRYVFFPEADLYSPVSLVISLLLAGTASSLSGLFLTWVVRGRDGLRDLARRLGHWRVNLAWYGVAVLTAPLLLVAALTLSARWAAATPSADLAGRIGLGIGIGLVAALVEEFGWRGFALPTLHAHRSALAASLIIGPLWAIWHLYPSYWQNAAAFGLPMFALNAVVGVIEFTAYATLMTWVSNNTRGSMLLMLAMHACFTGSQVVLIPFVTASDGLRIHSANAALLALVAAVVVATSGAQRMVRSQRVAPAM